METVSMAVYQHLLAQSVVQVSVIEGLKAAAVTNQAEIVRLLAEIAKLKKPCGYHDVDEYYRDEAKGSEVQGE